MIPGGIRGTARGAQGDGEEAFRREFEQSLDFPLDGFQRQSMDAIDRGESVLVSAPTGSGKTLVAEYAAARAVGRGARPSTRRRIKALSNQKFAELSLRYGEDRVGLLTGDVSHQARAPMVVMTTEVLRNMIFARSSLLDGLAVVVLDEVHYLQDPYRGLGVGGGAGAHPARGDLREPVGHGQQRLRLRGLAHLGAGDDEGHRGDPPAGDAAPPLRRGRAGERAASPCSRCSARGGPIPTVPCWTTGAARDPRHRLRVPRRTQVIEYLAAEDMLPAITFIFSRAACDDAVRQCLQDGVRLTTPEERQRIRQLTEERRRPPGRRRPGHTGVRTVVGRAGGRRGPAPRRPGAGVPPGRRAVLLGGPAEGGVRHRDAGPRHQHAGPDRRGGAVRQVPRVGHLGPHLGRVPAADRAGRPPRASTSWATPSSSGPRPRPSARWPVPRWRLRPTCVSSFHPTYNLAVNLVRRWSPGRGPPPAGRLVRPVAGAGGLGVARRPARPAAGHPRAPRAHRRLDMTEAGHALASIYHESDLLVTEALRPGAPRRAGAGARWPGWSRPSPSRPAGRGTKPGAPPEGGRRPAGPARGAGRRAAGRRAPGRPAPDPPSRPRTGPGRDRLGQGGHAGLGARESDVAPGDFVRNVRQVIDLVRQLAQVAPDPGTREAAELAVALLRRGVVGADDPASMGSAPDPPVPS